MILLLAMLLLRNMLQWLFSQIWPSGSTRKMEAELDDYSASVQKWAAVIVCSVRN